MPRLSNKKINKSSAIDYLLDLYMNEQAFVDKLCQIREPHKISLRHLDEALVNLWFSCKQYFSPKDNPIEFYYQCLSLKEIPQDLPNELRTQLEDMEHLWLEVQPCINEITLLAHQWKLRAPWAILVLAFIEFDNYIKIKSEHNNAYIPLETFNNSLPWFPPIKALKIKISPWCFTYYSREQIMKQIGKEIKDYENKMKKLGFQEYPSSLSHHANWWFQHYVLNKSYDEIAQEEAYKLDGSLISYAKNVGAAVRKFSRIIGIDPALLK